MDHIDTSINYIFTPEETVGMSMGNKLWALQICLSCNRTINIFVRSTYSYRGTSISLEYQQFSRAPPVVRSNYGCREHLQLSKVPPVVESDFCQTGSVIKSRD